MSDAERTAAIKAIEIALPYIQRAAAQSGASLSRAIYDAASVRITLGQLQSAQAVPA